MQCCFLLCVRHRVTFPMRLASPSTDRQRIEDLTPEGSRYKYTAPKKFFGEVKNDIFGKTIFPLLLSMQKRMGITRKPKKVKKLENETP